MAEALKRKRMQKESKFYLTWKIVRITLFWIVFPSSEAKAVVIYASFALTAIACYGPTDWRLASILHKGSTLLIVRVSILDHEGHFAFFLVAFDNQALVSRISGLIIFQRNNISFMSARLPLCRNFKR